MKIPKNQVKIDENTKNSGQNWWKYQKFRSKLVEIPKNQVKIGKNTKKSSQNWWKYQKIKSKLMKIPKIQVKIGGNTKNSGENSWQNQQNPQRIRWVFSYVKFERQRNRKQNGRLRETKDDDGDNSDLSGEATEIQPSLGHHPTLNSIPSSIEKLN